MTVAGRTFLQLQEEVLSFQFAPGKYRELVKTWLNDAQRIAVIESEIRTQEAAAEYETASGDATLEVPEDFSRRIDLFGANGDLEAIDLADFNGYPASSGQPSAYTVEDNQIRLWPTPDGSYDLTLRYWRLPQDMVNDSDEPEIPKQHHHRLIPYAMWKAYARENDRVERDLWKNDWYAELAKLRGEVQSDMFSGPRQVPGTWGEERPHTISLP